MSINKKLVFLVDDDLFHIEVMKHLLQNEGFDNIICFLNIKECLSNIPYSPHFLILDTQMELINEYQTVRYFKKYHPYTVIIMLSSFDNHDNLKEHAEKDSLYFLDKNKELQVNLKNLFSEIKDHNLQRRN
jgi:DNA-binding NtrC family response regulator